MKIFKAALAVAVTMAFTGCTVKITPEVSTGYDTLPTVSETEETSSEAETSASGENSDNISEQARRLLEKMTTGQKIAQLLQVRCPETEAAEIMSEYSFGGYTLYARDFKSRSKETAAEFIAEITSSADTAPFVAVDEEGGKIVRVSLYKAYRSEPFLSQLELAAGGEELIKRETKEKAELLLSLGINLNFAPVADITDNPKDYIYDRTFGADPETTGEYIKQTVSVMNESKLGSCLKHFPGYGSNVDTHTGVAVDERSAESFESADFVPFESGISAGVPMIMVSHNIITAYDDKKPASLSLSVHKLLREKLGYEGVIITDDLDMDAIKEYSGGESPYVLAVQAGNDMLCISEWDKATEEIKAAVDDGRITETRINESVIRVLEMKLRLGIISESKH